jgi:hypothetical protein
MLYEHVKLFETSFIQKQREPFTGCQLAFLMLGVYLQGRFNLGVWVVIVLGIIGFLTSISTARACLDSMRKEID